MPAMAKIIRSGAGQSVRLPKAFRFDADEVCIKRIGAAVLLFPRGQAWDLMERALGRVDDDFLAPRRQPRRTTRRKSL